MSWKGMEPLDKYLDENKLISIDWNALNADAEGKKKNAKELADYAIPTIIKYFKDNGYEFRTLK